MQKVRWNRNGEAEQIYANVRGGWRDGGRDYEVRRIKTYVGRMKREERWIEY